MPFFNNNTSAPIINPDIDPNEIPIDELPKCEGKRKLSIKKSFFTWSSQKQFIDQNKFLFDSNTVLPSKKGKKNHHDSYIIKSNKYNVSNSSVNYDESENEYSSESDNNNEGNEGEAKSYYSMEDLDNITALKKKKTPKVRNVTQLSESTLCYSSNTNTINTVSMEFNGKSKANDENQNNEEAINYGFDDNQNNDEVINYGFEENNQNNGEVINYGFEESNQHDGEIINYGFDDNQSSREKKNEVNDDKEKEKNNENNNEVDIMKKKNSIDTDNYTYDDDSDDADFESGGEDSEPYDFNSYYSNPSPTKKVSSTTKKTVTFCEDIEIIEPRKHKKTKNIFKRAISKIIKKKEGEEDDENVNI